MKINQFTIILFLLMSYTSIAQLETNYHRGFKIGFKEGYCYNNTSVSCLTPLTPLVPLPRINENKENYTEGYNRGFQFGLDLKRSKGAMEISDNSLNVSPNFNNYVSQNPVEAMRMVGMYKQQKFDARTNWTQERIYQLTDLIKNLFNGKNLPSYHIEKTRNIYLIKLRNYANSLSAIDFGDDYQFRNVVNGFISLEKILYSSYNSCVKSENQTKIETEAKESLKKQNEVEEQKEVEHKFSSNFLAKNKGEYCCEVSFYKLKKNKYVKTLTRKGYLDMDDDSMIYLDNFKDCSGEISITLEDNTMVFEDEVYDKNKFEYSYYSKTVVIDSDFKNITIYSSDKKTARVFKIKSKI